MEDLAKSFWVVGIGASAGGLEAVSELIEAIPATTGMAFLLVQHLDPRHPSLLAEILAKKAAIAVTTAADGEPIAPDHLYVIPPNTTLTAGDGLLRLSSRDDARPPKPVNVLFHSLAGQYAQRAIAIVLSGTDSDGAEGVQEIKAAGGITMAQDPATAKFDGMPQNAIATGSIDFVLPPGELGQQLLQIARVPVVSAALGQEEEGHLSRILQLLQSRTGTHFSHYKRSTVQRRMARRMALRQLAGLADYAELLDQEPDEIQALARDFLIQVTGFFRDPETFAGLAETVFPSLLAHRDPSDPIRIWVPGCASGEEAYSIAMVLLESLAGRAQESPIQIYATDLSDAAIEKARTGFYPDSIADEVTAERLQRFFIKLDDHYQIAKPVRGICVFARHDVTRDPPFSRLDLVSCRNLLIYLDQTLQRHILQLFHYALKLNGFLVLGPAETVGRSSDLFRLSEGGRQIYRKQPAARMAAQFAVAEAAARPGPAGTGAVANPGVLVESERVQRESERVLLARYAPAAIVIDDSQNVVYFQGETSRYLEHARGAASLNLQQICRPGLLVELAPALQEAQASERSVLRKGLRLGPPGSEQVLNFEIIPLRLAEMTTRYYLLLFSQPANPRISLPPGGSLVRWWQALLGAGGAAETAKDREIQQLRRELQATRDYLEAAAEEHEAAKEEMKSAHEEALSANEEFLSTNEELETAKEELQSANEELGVTNQELRDRNRELGDLNDELRQSRNYLDAIVETLHEPLLVLDGELRIQKANHEFYETFHVRPEETLRRYLYDLGDGQWDMPALRRLLVQVLPESSSLRDFEVEHEFPGIGTKIMLLNARRLKDTGPGEMILLAIEDITARQLSQNKLVEADQRKNNFLATLAHELRNPLAPIRLGVQLLRRDAQEPALKQLGIMERQIQNLTGLVDDLLDIARIERDHIELRKEPVNLVSFLNDTVEASRRLFNERHQQLSLALPPAALHVSADPIRLEQIISNLLSNAAKYTDEGGAIAITLERRNEEAVITVRDNGEGIAPELLPQLFEMFFQANASLARTGGGLGIGLSVAKRLVELHGGRIEGHSAGLGQGSEFTIRLPALPVADYPNDSQPAELPKAPVELFHVHKVLIVDDNLDTAEIVAEFARFNGHETAVAHDGPAALALVSKFHPDIALIDIGLPRMNGYELARRLRELPEMKSVLLVAITGYARDEDRAEAYAAGFTLHLVKPVDPVRLQKLLAELQ